MSKQDNRFIKNAAILSVAGIFVRALGAVYRIPLARYAGQEVTGLYQMAYPIYSTLLAISVTGPPIAIAKMIAERIAKNRWHAAHRVFILSLWVLGAVGLLSTIILMLGSNYLVSNVLGDERALWALLAMAPAIFLVALMSGMRGFFQGLQNMLPYAFSQMLEQVVRVGIALGLTLFLLSNGREPKVVAGGISLGVSLGALAGLLVLIAAYLRVRPRLLKQLKAKEVHYETAGSLVRELLTLAIPITIGGIVLPLMQLIDASVVPRRLLVAGFTQTEATGLYGQLSGMATPLINLPQMFTVALVASLIPSIAESMSLGRRQLMQYRSTMALKLAMLFNLPAAVGLSVLAGPIAILLYGSESGAGVGRPLSVLALVVAFLAVQQTTSGILQGLGKTHLPVINLFFGAMAKLVATIFLTAIPTLNIQGSALATLIGFIVSSTLNFRAMRRVSGITISIGQVFLRPLLASVGMGASAFYTYSWLNDLLLSRGGGGLLSPNTLATLVAIGVAGLVYLVLILLTGSLTVQELSYIPKLGPRMAKVLLKLRLIREE